MAAPKNIDWDAQPLGQKSDIEIARALGVRESAARWARTKRGINRYTRVDWDDQPLGQKSDIEIACALGVGGATVMRARVKRGIPAYNQIDWDAQPLGQKNDAEIARALGVDRGNVRDARVRRGIEKKETRCVRCGALIRGGLRCVECCMRRSNARGTLAYSLKADPPQSLVDLLAEVYHQNAIFKSQRAR